MKCFRKSDQKHFVALRWGMPRRLCFVCLHSGYLICIWNTLRSHFGPNLIHRAPNSTFLSPFLDGEEGSGCYEGQGEASGQYDKPTSVTEEARGPADDGRPRHGSGRLGAMGSVRTVWGSTVSDRRNTRARHSRCLHAVFESDRRNTSYRPSLLVLSYSSLL